MTGFRAQSGRLSVRLIKVRHLDSNETSRVADQLTAGARQHGERNGRRRRTGTERFPQRTGTAHTADGRWSGDATEEGHGGELEPKDSRNVTGTAVTEDGRWTGAAVLPEEGPQVPEENDDAST